MENVPLPYGEINNSPRGQDLIESLRYPLHRENPSANEFHSIDVRARAGLMPTTVKHCFVDADAASAGSS